MCDCTRVDKHPFFAPFLCTFCGTFYVYNTIGHQQLIYVIRKFYDFKIYPKSYENKGKIFLIKVGAPQYVQTPAVIYPVTVMDQITKTEVAHTMGQ